MTESATIKVRRLDHGADIDLPEYETAGASGMDLRAACPQDEPIRLAPGMRALIPTGLTMEIPAGFEGQVRPRSGLALRHGITVLNSPGTIDADYRGEIQVLLINLGQGEFEIQRGMRIAQLVFQHVRQPPLCQVEELTTSGRGQGGFGSTGR